MAGGGRKAARIRGAGPRGSSFGRRRGLPVAGQEVGDLGNVHRGQPAQDVGEVFLGVDPATAATDDQGVDDGTAPTRVGMPDEEPPATANCRNADRVFDQVMPTAGLCRVADSIHAFSA